VNGTVRQLILISTLTLGPLCAQGLPRVKGNDVWVTRDIRWEKAPPEYNPNLSTGSATVLYFRSDGRFGLMYCRLNKGPNYLVVSNGDGQVVSEGYWEMQAEGLKVRYRLIFQTVSRVPPEELPGPEEKALITMTARDELRFGDKVFVPIGDRLPASELDPGFFNFRTARSSPMPANTK